MRISISHPPFGPMVLAIVGLAVLYGGLFALRSFNGDFHKFLIIAWSIAAMAGLLQIRVETVV
jgi:hypothetical protein